MRYSTKRCSVFCLYTKTYFNENLSFFLNFSYFFNSDIIAIFTREPIITFATTLLPFLKVHYPIFQNDNTKDSLYAFCISRK